MKKIRLPVIALLFLLGGCLTTDLSKVDIADVMPVFSDEESGGMEYLIPGREYKIKILVTDREGNRIDRPNHTGFLISSENGTLILKKRKPLSIVLESTSDMFLLIKEQKFSLGIGVEKQSFEEKVFQWPVDWWEPLTLSYGGADGADGFLYADVSTAENGRPGERGKNGEDGKNAVLYAFFYDISDLNITNFNSDTMILIVNPSEKSANLAPLHLFVDARGGNGGFGADGEDVFIPEETEEKEKPDANGEISEPGGADVQPQAQSPKRHPAEGGDGGRGGDGGDGGDVILYYRDPAILDFISVNADGGRGGEGGDGGDSGHTENGPVHTGRDGRPGRDGSKGEIRILPLNPAKADAVLSVISNPLFERSRVLTD